MGKYSRTQYVLERHPEIQQYDVIRIGARGGRTILASYRSETCAEELAELLNKIEFSRWT